jgi:hypothetical protein
MLLFAKSLPNANRAGSGSGSCNAPNPNDRIYSQGHPASDPADTWFPADFSVSLNGCVRLCKFKHIKNLELCKNTKDVLLLLQLVLRSLQLGVDYVPQIRHQ